MANRTKNRPPGYWGKWIPGKQAAPAKLTEFEQLAADIPPDRWVRSTKLRKFARRNYNRRYVPENLLEAWGLTVDDGFHGLLF